MNLSPFGEVHIQRTPRDPKRSATSQSPGDQDTSVTRHKPKRYSTHTSQIAEWSYTDRVFDCTPEPYDVQLDDSGDDIHQLDESGNTHTHISNIRRHVTHLPGDPNQYNEWNFQKDFDSIELTATDDNDLDYLILTQVIPGALPQHCHVLSIDW